MSGISTHILDTASGRPAAGVRVTLSFQSGHDGFTELGTGTTDSDGRIRNMVQAGELRPGTYKLSFETGSYFAGIGTRPFHPSVDIVFTVQNESEHYHVPLLISPFGYTTYRGS